VGASGPYRAFPTGAVIIRARPRRVPICSLPPIRS
jgi:hypothetical protein